jgi:NADH-quinone oxidoreductase subunit L
VLPAHGAMEELKEEFHGVWAMVTHGVMALPFWLALAGAGTAWYLYVARPDLPKVVAGKFGIVYAIVERKYGFDELYAWAFSGGARVLGGGLWKYGDQRLIDGLAVNGTARLVGWFSRLARVFQSGLVYQYAFAMIIGVFVLLTHWLWSAR